MSGDATQFLLDTAKIAAAFTAIAAAIAVLMHHRSPLRRVTRWLFRRNVTEPVGVWLRRSVQAAMAIDITRLDRRITELSERNDAQHLENAEAIHEIRELLARDPESRTRADDEE